MIKSKNFGGVLTMRAMILNPRSGERIWLRQGQIWLSSGIWGSKLKFANCALIFWNLRNKKETDYKNIGKKKNREAHCDMLPVLFVKSWTVDIGCFSCGSRLASSLIDFFLFCGIFWIVDGEKKGYSSYHGRQIPPALSVGSMSISRFVQPFLYWFQCCCNEMRQSDAAGG